MNTLNKDEGFNKSPYLLITIRLNNIIFYQPS
jgi:hypothetical protein